MSKYRKKYQKIISELIKKSFPELKGSKLKVIEFPSFLLFWSFAQKGIDNYYIFINISRRDCSGSSLKGQLVHELCHIVLDHRHHNFIGDFFHNLRKFISFIFNTSFSRKIERSVDKEVIRRGYARELLISHGDWKKNLSKEEVNSLYARGYLLPKEIKSYANKIGKW